MKRCFNILFLLPFWMVLGCGGQWQVEGAGTFSAGPIVDRGRVFVAASRYGITRQLRAYDARSGLELWQVELGGWQDYPQLAAMDDLVLVANDSLVAAYEASTGLRKWVRRPEGPPEGSFLFARDTIAYVVQGPELEMRLEILAAATGQRLAQRALPPESRLYQVGDAFYAVSSESIVSLEAASGRQQWTVVREEAPASLVASPASLIVVNKESIEGLDPRTGRRKWLRSTEGQVAPMALERLLCYAQGGMIYGIDADSGLDKWRRRLAGVVSPPALHRDMVYVHTAGGTLHALSSVDGESVWQLTIGPPGQHAALDGEFYVWVFQDEIRVVDLIEREPARSFVLGGGSSAGEGGDVSGIDLPLCLSGSRLYGVDGRTRLFMYDLRR